MRELKFRCWNNWGKCFHDMQELIDGNKLHLFNNKDDCYVIEQFTGLTDKNGVEIYEGDIQKTTRLDGFYWIYVVTAVGGQFGFNLYAKCIEHNLSYDDSGNRIREVKRIKLEDQNTHCNIIHGDSCEVIGNIHQNPELLESAK